MVGLGYASENICILNACIEVAQTVFLALYMKKHTKAALVILGFNVMANIMSIDKTEKGIIGRTTENGRPVIWKFINEIPNDAKRRKLPWLTVISWKYDGDSNNGMPSKDVNDQMIRLEETIEQRLEKKGFCEHANSRTGNNLKEFVYYIANREQFMARFNEALTEHPAYPIEINFYEDPEWKEFASLINDFGGAQNLKKGQKSKSKN
ncbi:hypothetical protein Turpa_3327 [Turneriella parva DSM 21527]|uniref:DUF695 domain-containing protein n=2 Tax=Turneriella TaxID=338321 RepID=I4B9K8_TURPD|nr:hypothetical protein Turpa_3327 [Turneriella parva DSM 21527]